LEKDKRGEDHARKQKRVCTERGKRPGD
jgi:hypothetical protein